MEFVGILVCLYKCVCVCVLNSSYTASLHCELLSSSGFRRCLSSSSRPQEEALVPCRAESGEDGITADMNDDKLKGVYGVPVPGPVEDRKARKFLQEPLS